MRSAVFAIALLSSGGCGHDSTPPDAALPCAQVGDRIECPSGFHVEDFRGEPTPSWTCAAWAPLTGDTMCSADACASGEHHVTDGVSVWCATSP